jgi:hypothetical protein
VVRRLGQKTGGEKLHNRYILTDLGGVAFGVGLDEGDDGETDDLTLMDRALYELRWSQYDGDPPPGFEQEETPVEVEGTRRLPMPSQGPAAGAAGAGVARSRDGRSRDME